MTPTGWRENARVEFPGAVYQVLDQGDRRDAIFREGSDRDLFAATLTEACLRTGWRGHAWVLVNNHYHLLIETPELNLVAGIRWLQLTYTVRFNRKLNTAKTSGACPQCRYGKVAQTPRRVGVSNPLRVALRRLREAVLIVH